MRKRAPLLPSESGRRSSVPPWSSTKRRATARPSPVPLFLPNVAKGWNKRSRTSGATPGPSSARTISSCSPAARRVHGAGGDVEAPGAPHRVAGVGGNVGDDAPQLVHVEGRGGGGRHVEGVLDLDPGHLGGEPAPQIGEEHGQGDRAAGQPPPSAREVEGLARHALQAVDRLHDEGSPGLHLSRGEGGLEQRLRVPADHGHGPAEIVGEHARHRPQGGQALRGDELLLVDVVLEGEGRPRRDHGDQPGLRGAQGEGAVAPFGPEDQHAGEATAGHEGDERAFPLARRVQKLTVGQEIAGLRGFQAVRSRPQGVHVRLTSRGSDAFEGLEAAVPDEEGRPPDAERGGQGPGQDVDETVEVRRFQDLVGESAERRQARRPHDTGV